MAQQRSDGGGRPAQLSVGDARAAIVREQLGAHPELERVKEIGGLPRLATWAPTILGDGIERLVADETTSEAADGRVCVRPRRTAA
jgi:hypothetical protein